MKCSGVTLSILLAVLGGTFLTLGPAETRQGMAADLSPLALRAAQASNDPALGSQEEASVEDTPGHFDAGPLPDDELAAQSPVTPEPSTYRFEYPEGNADDGENRQTVCDENTDREAAPDANEDARETEAADNATPCRQTSDPELAGSDEPDKGMMTDEETPDDHIADDETADDETPEDGMTDEETPDDDAADDDIADDETADDETDQMADDPTGDEVPAEEETADPEMADDQPAEDENLQDDCADGEEVADGEDENADGEDDAESEDGDDAGEPGDGDRCAGEDHSAMTEPELPPAQPEAPSAEPESPPAPPEAPDASLNADPSPTPYGGDFGCKYGNRYGYKYGYEDAVSGPQYGEPGSVAPQTETQTEPSQERDASIDEASETSRASAALQDLAQPPVETADTGEREGNGRATVGVLADVLQRVVLRVANGTVGALWNASRDLAGTEWGGVLRSWTGGRVVNPWGRVELWLPR